MLRCIGPLQMGQLCSVAANSSRTHALQSAFLHFHIFVGFKFEVVSLFVVTYLMIPFKHICLLLM